MFVGQNPDFVETSASSHYRMCVYIYIHLYTHTHTQIHIYTYTYIYLTLQRHVCQLHITVSVSNGPKVRMNISAMED